MTFRVGQKVVCVDATPVIEGAPFIDTGGKFMISNGDMGGLSKGSIYTIQEIRSRAAGAGLVLLEINRHNHFMSEPGFRAARFRPIVERKTDISIFTKLLTPTGVDA